MREVLSLFRGLLHVPETMREIEATVAAEHGLTPSDLHIATRRHAISRPRRVAMVRMLDEGFTSGQVGARFGIDPSTIRHYRRLAVAA